MDTMKAFLIIGGLVVVGATALCVYKNRHTLNHQTNRSNEKSSNWGQGLIDKNKNKFVSQRIDLREVESISMRTFGSWLKEQDFPSYDGYRLYILNADTFPKEYFAKASEEYVTAYRYGFAITDSNMNIMSACLILAKNVDESFKAKIVSEVNEIHINS